MAGAVYVMAIAVFVGGVLIGAIGAVAAGVGREDRRHLHIPPGGPLSH